MKSFFLKLLMKEFFEFLWKKAEELWKKHVATKEADKKVDDIAQGAVEEIRKPLDPTKSVEERERDAEAAADKFHNTLK